LNILQQQIDKPIQLNRAEKLTLAVLSANLKKQTNRPVQQFQKLIRIFQPETVFGWQVQAIRVVFLWLTQTIHKYQPQRRTK
jgi:hypothetical protein